jgi:hypothetical protein
LQLRLQHAELDPQIAKFWSFSLPEYGTDISGKIGSHPHTQK